MKYFIHIDESGDFSEGHNGSKAGGSQRPSVVGGVCSRLSDGEWKDLHRGLVEDFNANNATSFQCPLHFHSSRLLSGDLPETQSIPKTVRRQFIQSVCDNVLTHATFGFLSVNRGARFQFSPQATYGVNLVAALKACLEHLAITAPDCDALEIIIAQRTIGETQLYKNNSRTYMDDLRPFMMAQICVGGTSSSKLALRLKDTKSIYLVSRVADHEGGLMAADFVCSARSNDDLARRITVQTEPSDILFGDFETAYKKQVKELTESQQYSAALITARRCLQAPEAAIETPRIFEKLAAETDPGILGRELAALLADARMLIDNRVSEPHALTAAREILQALHAIANAHLAADSDPSIKRKWADFLIEGLSELVACYNHVGETKIQYDIELRLEQALKDYGNLVSKTYHQKKEILLEVKNRNLNILFNDYRFDEVIDAFDQETSRREAEIPTDETDELLGKMLGSLGQAYAFLGHTDPDWSSTARDFFQRSQRHFAEGTSFRAMSVNYLTTLAFQERQLDDACREMSRHPALPQIDNAEALTQRFHEFAAHKNASPFDAVNYARIATLAVESGININSDSLRRALRHWQPQIATDHPYPLLCKWLGYLFYLTNDHKQASELYEKGIEISQELEFTVKTIGLPILGLNAICLKKLGDEPGYKNNRNRLNVLAEKLANQSTGFTAYLSPLGGPLGVGALLDQPHEQAALQLSRLLPFGYM